MHTSTHITIISQVISLLQEMWVLLAARHPTSHSGPGGDMEEIERGEGIGERVEERSDACWDSYLVTGFALASIQWSTHAITSTTAIYVGSLFAKRG